MKKQTIILISILIVLLVACTNRSNYHQILIQANSLMTTMPDSALHILQDIIPQQLPTQADKAYYALLFTQAQDKNFILQTKDSLICTAVQYYDSIKDERMQAKAYYYWGCIYRDSNKQSVAIEKYLTAISLALKINDEPLLGRIYNSMGYLYYLQGLYDRADSIYLKTEQIGIQLKDTSLWAESLSMQGNIKFNQQLYQQAEKNLLQAIHVLGNFKQDKIQSAIAATLSSLYGKTGDGAKAVQYAKQNIRLQKDTTNCYRAFLILGDAYFKMEQYDSAKIYICKSLSSKRYGNKAGAYMRLADIAKVQGKIDQALEMERLYSAYKDSLNQSLQTGEILEVEQKVKMQQQRSQYEEFLKEYRYYIIITLLISALLFYILHKYYLKNLHKQKYKQLQIENRLRQEYVQQQELLTQKEKEITILQNKINHQDINRKQQQVLQAELNKLNNQRNNLIKEILEYSEVNTKINHILSDYKVKGHSKEFLDKNDWARLMAEVDKNGIIQHISNKYSLSEEETHLCCLLLLDYSVVDRGRLMRCERLTVYRKERKILEKMGMNYQVGELQKLIKSMINDKFIE